MLKGKERSYLKKLAHSLEPTVFIGKAGITENIKKELETGFGSPRRTGIRSSSPSGAGPTPTSPSASATWSTPGRANPTTP